MPQLLAYTHTHSHACKSFAHKTRQMHCYAQAVHRKIEKKEKNNNNQHEKWNETMQNIK